MNRCCVLLVGSAWLAGAGCVGGIDESARYTCANNADCVQDRQCSGVQPVPAASLDAETAAELGMVVEGTTGFLSYCLPSGENACGEDNACGEGLTCAAVALPEAAVEQYCVMVKRIAGDDWWKISVTQQPTIPAVGDGIMEATASGPPSHRLKLWRNRSTLELWVDDQPRDTAADATFVGFDRIALIAPGVRNLERGAFDNVDIISCQNDSCGEQTGLWSDYFERTALLDEWIALSGTIELQNNRLSVAGDGSQRGVAMRLNNLVIESMWQVSVTLEVPDPNGAAGFCMQRSGAALRCVDARTFPTADINVARQYDCKDVYTNKCVTSDAARPLCARVFALASDEVAAGGAIAHQCVPVDALTLPIRQD